MAKTASKRFVLNDESVLNSYGFMILSKGGKLDRFTDNPVMLSDHVNRNENVIGKWLNIEVKDGKIYADPEFDEEIPLGLDISGKVGRGYLKGASMGILPNWQSLEDVGGMLVLKEWELVEASIVPVPSNRNSIAVYGIDGKLLEESEIKNLCLSAIPGDPNPKTNLKNHSMKKVVLSMACLMALSFKDQPQDGLDVSEVESKIMELSGKNATLASENETLKLAAQTAKEAREAEVKLAATQKVDLAITQGKIPADKKDAFVQLGVSSPEVLEATLSAIPGKQNFSANVKTENGAVSEVKTMEDFQKLSFDAQLAFKNDNPDEYKKIVG